MNEKRIGVARAVLVQVIALVLSLPAFAGDAPKLTREQVKEMLGKPDVVIVDVRADAVEPGDLKIAGAVVEDPKKVSEWAGKYPEAKGLILYCA